MKVGVNAEFKKGLGQHIEGVLTHNHGDVALNSLIICMSSKNKIFHIGLTIYRSFPTVDADSDFTIFCLLSELKKWADVHDGIFPTTWYIQIDGGSENANQYLLAVLEYLTIKRICRTILLTRYFYQYYRCK